MRTNKSHNYLVSQAQRFKTREQSPPGLTQVTIMGVDYVYGQVESTGGALWVGGRGPVLWVRLGNDSFAVDVGRADRSVSETWIGRRLAGGDPARMLPS